MDLEKTRVLVMQLCIYFTLELIYGELDQGDKCLAIFIIDIARSLTPFLMTNK